MRHVRLISDRTPPLPHCQLVRSKVWFLPGCRSRHFIVLLQPSRPVRAPGVYPCKIARLFFYAEHRARVGGFEASMLGTLTATPRRLRDVCFTCFLIRLDYCNSPHRPTYVFAASASAGPQHGSAPHVSILHVFFVFGVFAFCSKYSLLTFPLQQLCWLPKDKLIDE